MERIDFSEALARLKKGYSVERARWDHGYAVQITCPTRRRPYLELFQYGYEGTPYTPTHEDILAEDWRIVP